MRGTNVDKVNLKAVDGRPKLREAIEPGLRLRPVVLIKPLPAQLTRVRERRPLRPVAHRLSLGPTSPAQPIPEILDLGFRYVDVKRDDPMTHSTGS